MLLPTAVSTRNEPPQYVIAVDSIETATMTKACVASLLPTDIGRMSREQLAEAVRAAEFPLQQPQLEAKFEFSDRQVLERHVFAARRCCRNQGY